MSILAIKGHPIRGKEVIEILEMLGGKNQHEYVADSDCFGFFIGNETRNKTIYYDWLHNFYDEDVVFTLEEFLEKFPYKVGDKVSSKYLKNYKIEKMEWEDTNNRVIYKLKGMGWYSADELQPYKEESMYLNEKANKQAEEIKKLLEPIKEIIEEIKVDIPKGYEFAGVDDNKQQVVFTKIQPQYPKTYWDCAKFINRFAGDKVNGYNYDLIRNLQRLLICRDAYWKIAGEQMGLGNPWKPSKNDNVYCIFRLKGEIVKDNFVFGDSLILEFSTKEMRDIFYENFKDLIEECKELL